VKRVKIFYLDKSYLLWLYNENDLAFIFITYKNCLAFQRNCSDYLLIISYSILTDIFVISNRYVSFTHYCLSSKQN